MRNRLASYCCKPTVPIRQLSVATTAFLTAALLVACATDSPAPEAAPNVSSRQPGETFRDCPDCPEMVVVPAGRFSLGSPEDDPGRVEDEGPQQDIEISSFAVSRFEVTRAQYASFSRDTGRAAGGCFVMEEDGPWQPDADASWREPGFAQSEDHPVVCVSWQDAQAFVGWLNEQVKGEPYRLLSESEWEYVARAGSSTPYWWGTEEADFCAYANGADTLARERYPSWLKTGPCADGYLYTAPVGSYGQANSFGLFDTAGNVWEWVEDCYRDSYAEQPAGGVAFTGGECKRRVLRGGAWGDYGSFYLRTAYRGAFDPTWSFANLGLRVARSL